MSRHPVTPMHEGDLIRHLAKQTRKRISLVPLDKIQAGQACAAFDSASRSADAVLFDGVELRDLARTGEVLLSRGVRFAVGSSGVTRALVLAWRERGLIDNVITPAPVHEVQRMLVVSGSCSPMTARQIAKAAEQGFETRLIDVSAVLRGDREEEQRLTASALAVLGSGRSCVIHSAVGPLDTRETPAGDRLGEALGRIARALIRQSSLRRVLFAGGDTSSHGVAQLGVDALTWAAPLEAGAPLVRCHSADASVDGLQMVLKGGQIGSEDFFELVRRGTLPAKRSA
jgi:uncharacterized protein YgbK (DUF1537 family)